MIETINWEGSAGIKLELEEVNDDDESHAELGELRNDILFNKNKFFQYEQIIVSFFLFFFVCLAAVHCLYVWVNETTRFDFSKKQF